MGGEDIAREERRQGGRDGLCRLSPPEGKGMNGRRKRRREGEKKRNKQCPLYSTRVPHCETASNLPYVQMEKRSNVQILKKSHGKRKINVLPASGC